MSLCSKIEVCFIIGREEETLVRREATKAPSLVPLDGGGCSDEERGTIEASERHSW